MKIWLAAAFAFVCVAGQAAAQNRQIALFGLQERPAALSAGGDTYANRLGRAVDGLADLFPAGCPRMEARSLAFHDIGDEDGLTRAIAQQGSHIYRERLLVEACAQQYIANFYIIQAPDQPPSITIGAPGETIAGLQLQHLAQPQIRQAAGAKVSCTDDARIFVVHSEVTQPPAEVGRAWRERWTYDACEQRVEVPIDFIPDANGVRFDVRAAEARVLPAS
ncbi:MAG: hypothetical protein AB7O04_07030 [Hyphomonadaceae bacterium]